jgi:hypothetical protein
MCFSSFTFTANQYKRHQLMKKYLLLLPFIAGAYLSVGAQYQRSKSETIYFINNTLKFREDTRLYESGTESRSNHLILSQYLNANAGSFKQVMQTTTNKQQSVTVSKIRWEALRAFGYNDNRSELYIYFNTKIMVGNGAADVFSMYVPDDKVDEMKNEILHLVDVIKGEK